MNHPPPPPDLLQSAVDLGLDRERQMLVRAQKGLLGPTMSCVFDDSIKDPLAAFSPEEFGQLSQHTQRVLNYRHARKYRQEAPYPTFTPGQRSAFLKGRDQKRNKAERAGEMAALVALEKQLAPFLQPPRDELKGMDAEAKKLADAALRELNRPVWLEAGDLKPRIGRDADVMAFDDLEDLDDLLDPRLPPLTIDFLDVGMGDSTLFVCGDGTTVLIDCGTASNDKTGALDALGFLRGRLAELQQQRGLTAPRIDCIYITHADRDHYNLLPSLFTHVPGLEVSTFHIAGTQKDYDKKLDLFKVKSLPTMTGVFAKAKNVVTYPSGHTGDAAPALVSEPSATGGKVSFRTLCVNTVPTHGETPTNASSIVLLVEMVPTHVDDETPPVKILMMGDGETTVEEVLVKHHPQAIEGATLLHVGHHGSQIAAGTTFLRAVDPRVAQISADQNWAHPYRSTVERITGDPKLRVNEAMDEDATHPIVFGEGGGSTKVHTQVDTRSALLMNIGEQEADTSGSAKATKAAKDGSTPTVAIGQQWRLQFAADGSFHPFSTREDPDVIFLPPSTK